MTVPDPGDPWEKLRDYNELMRRVEETPMPSAIFTDDRVPGVKRQWMADGSLVLWVNSEFIDRLPRMAIRSYDQMDPVSRLTSIPVYDRRGE